ncbi:MAG: NYN domain-containing protein [Planctomycetes bacterium]|nr:NYN domain-containing protein [Planctomycetota bacterium]
MSTTPPLVTKPRAFVFFDGQNLFHDAEREFAVSHPDFDPFKLANLVCNQRGWDLRHIRFYTGVPTEQQNRTWSVFWANKGAAMKRLGIEVVTRKLNYKTISIKLYDQVTIYLLDGSEYPGRLHFDNLAEVPDGVILETTTFTEKGIDVRLAVDMIRFFREEQYDVALVFSRDKDLAEAVEEVKRLATATNTPITLASAFPSKDGTGSGIPGTIHIPLLQADYDACRDPRNYFPRS